MIKLHQRNLAATAQQNINLDKVAQRGCYNRPSFLTMHKHYNEVMLDLETLGLANDAAILSIGAVKFNLDDVETYEEIEKGYRRCFYRTISLLDLKGAVDGETVQWWLKQSEEARKTLHEATSRNHDALTDYSDWLNIIEEGDLKLWANGAGFDPVILRSSYVRERLRAPWNFRQEMDVRTIKYLALQKDPEVDLNIYKITDKGVAHNALSDAIRQVLLVQRCWRALTGKLNESERK